MTSDGLERVLPCRHSPSDALLLFSRRQRIDEVLGDIEFNVFHRYFDMMFVVSASCSVGALCLLKFSKASRTTNDYGAHDKFP